MKMTMKQDVVLDGLKIGAPVIKSMVVFALVLVLGISSNLVSSKTIKHKQGTCQQIGKPEENVTLMYGMNHPNVKLDLIGHVRTLDDCVKIACRRENASLAYTSRFDCFSVTCHGDEELCWFLPSFKNPSLIFARLTRTSSDADKNTNDKSTAKEKDKGRRRPRLPNKTTTNIN